MKSIPVVDSGSLESALRKYTHGRKLDIRQFNQAARLAGLDLVSLSPLDPEAPECKAWILHLEQPVGLAAKVLELDEDLMSRMHVLDAEQGAHLADLLRTGFEARANDLQSLARCEFYLEKYFDSSERR